MASTAGSSSTISTTSPSRAGRRVSPAWPPCGACRAGLASRQQQRHGGAAARGRDDIDIAAGLLDEAVDLAEAEPGAAPDLLGGEERLERLGRDRRIHPGAGVAHRDADIAAWHQIPVFPAGQDRVAGGYDHAPALRHRVAGIADQVEDRRLELPGIEADRRQIGSQVVIDRHRVAGRPLQQLAEFPQAEIEVDDLGIDQLPAGERQQLLGHLSATPRRQQHVLGEPPDPRRIFGTAVDQLDIADDDGQQIVEVMRHSAGHLADRLQALGAQQLGLRQLAPGHLLAGEGEGVLLAPGAAQRGPGDRDQCERRRDAEDQLPRGAALPGGGDRAARLAGHDIQGKPFHLAVIEDAFRRIRIDIAVADIAAAIWRGLGRGVERTVFRQFRQVPVDRRIADQNLAVIADQGDDLARPVAVLARQDAVELAKKRG